MYLCQPTFKTFFKWVLWNHPSSPRELFLYLPSTENGYPEVPNLILERGKNPSEPFSWIGCSHDGIFWLADRKLFHIVALSDGALTFMQISLCFLPRNWPFRRICTLKRRIVALSGLLPSLTPTPGHSRSRYPFILIIDGESGNGSVTYCEKHINLGLETTRQSVM